MCSPLTNYTPSDLRNTFPKKHAIRGHSTASAAILIPRMKFDVCPIARPSGSRYTDEIDPTAKKMQGVPDMHAYEDAFAPPLGV